MKQNKDFSLVGLPVARPFGNIRPGKYESRAFSLVELMVVVAIIALLISILIPTLTRAEEQARQAVCQGNLRGINTGWVLYSRENNASPPILPDHNSNVHLYYNHDLEMGDQCTVSSLGQGAQQNLCLLVKINAVPWGMFLCPSAESSSEADRSGSGRKFGLGETGRLYCDYALQVPYVYHQNKCPLSKHMDGGIVIMGDRPPQRDPRYSECRDNWSPNHPEYGESILFMSGNVKFCKDVNTVGSSTSKNTGGWGGNNVYTRDFWDSSTPKSPKLTGYFDTASAYPASTKDTVLWSWTP